MATLPANIVMPIVWSATTETLWDVTCASLSMPAVVPLAIGAAVSTSLLTCPCGAPLAAWLAVWAANWLTGVKLWVVAVAAAARPIALPFNALASVVASWIWSGSLELAIT